MAQYAFHFDSNKCTGCKTCQVACKETYKLPVNNLYRKVLNYQGGTWELNEAGSYVPNGVFGYFVSMACNHCVDPACVANCPTGAMQKDEETGIVWTDHEVCIGCKTCIEACPYHAPCYDEQESKTYKCDMCTDRQERGELPACGAACPGMNLAVGEMADLEKAHQADIVSDDAVETKPNFVITVDPALSAEPDDTAVEARAAELAASKTAKKA